MKPNDKAYEAARYEELIKALRSSSPYTLSHVAADALEAVLAERDALKAERDAANKRAANRLAVEAERDALLARLAPANDEALVERAAKAISKQVPDQGVQWGDIRDAAIDAIAAVRPHIEAVERERCAKIADKYEGEWHSDPAEDACARAIAAAIRSGK